MLLQIARYSNILIKCVIYNEFVLFGGKPIMKNCIISCILFNHSLQLSICNTLLFIDNEGLQIVNILLPLHIHSTKDFYN